MGKKSFKRLFEEAEETDTFWVESAYIEFMEDICTLQEKYEVSDKELSKRLGIPETALSSLYRGDTELTLPMMVKLCRALNPDLYIRIEIRRRIDPRDLVGPFDPDSLGERGRNNG